MFCKILYNPDYIICIVHYLYTSPVSKKHKYKKRFILFVHILYVF